MAYLIRLAFCDFWSFGVFGNFNLLTLMTNLFFIFQLHKKWFEHVVEITWVCCDFFLSGKIKTYLCNYLVVNIDFYVHCKRHASQKLLPFEFYLGLFLFKRIFIASTFIFLIRSSKFEDECRFMAVCRSFDSQQNSLIKLVFDPCRDIWWMFTKENMILNQSAIICFWCIRGLIYHRIDARFTCIWQKKVPHYTNCIESYLQSIFPRVDFAFESFFLKIPKRYTINMSMLRNWNSWSLELLLDFTYKITKNFVVSLICKTNWRDKNP